MQLRWKANLFDSKGSVRTFGNSNHVNCFQKMFERTVNDFIRGLRSHKYSADYVLKCQNEIQVEINQPSKRKNAIQKLLILYLIGNDITWAAFHV